MLTDWDEGGTPVQQKISVDLSEYQGRQLVGRDGANDSTSSSLDGALGANFRFLVMFYVIVFLSVFLL